MDVIIPRSLIHWLQCLFLELFVLYAPCNCAKAKFSGKNCEVFFTYSKAQVAFVNFRHHFISFWHILHQENPLQNTVTIIFSAENCVFAFLNREDSLWTQFMDSCFVEGSQKSLSWDKTVKFFSKICRLRRFLFRAQKPKNPACRNSVQP